MSDNEGVLFIPYADTLDLLNAKEALQIAEDVYRMQGEGSVMASTPPSFKLDVGEPFYNHWHVKCALLKETEITGVRLYNYFDDGNRNTVGQLECGRYITLDLCHPQCGGDHPAAQMARPQRPEGGWHCRRWNDGNQCAALSCRAL
jgi:hypothetical protein